jgi:hypothetical protein
MTVSPPATTHPPTRPPIIRVILSRKTQSVASAACRTKK